MRKRRGVLVIIVRISMMGILSVFSLLSMNLMCNFNFAELASPDTGEVLVRPELVENIDKLVRGFPYSPKPFGFLNIGPLKITSGYRTPEHNKKVGGVSKSYHMKGMAIDCWCVGVSHRDLAKMALEVGFTTAIIYDTHVHLDIREEGLGLRKS